MMTVGKTACITHVMVTFVVVVFGNMCGMFYILVERRNGKDLTTERMCSYKIWEKPRRNWKWYNTRYGKVLCALYFHNIYIISVFHSFLQSLYIALYIRCFYSCGNAVKFINESIYRNPLAYAWLSCFPYCNSFIHFAFCAGQTQPKCSYM